MMDPVKTRRVSRVVIFLWIALAGATLIVLRFWSYDSDVGVYCIDRPCGSGYQRHYCIPAPLVWISFLLSIVLPLFWCFLCLYRHLISAAAAREHVRGFEVILPCETPNRDV